MNETKTLGQRLKDCREAKGIKQADAARTLNLQRQALSYYENDSRQPDVEKLADLAKLYGVSTDYLLGLTDVQSSDTELKSVCEYTGLKERAVKILHDHAIRGNDFSVYRSSNTLELHDKDLIRAVNLLILYGTHTHLFTHLFDFINSDHMRIVNDNPDLKYDNAVTIKNDLTESAKTIYILSNEQLEEIALMIFERDIRSLKSAVNSNVRLAETEVKLV